MVVIPHVSAPAAFSACSLTTHVPGYDCLQVKVYNITNDVLGSVIDTAVQAGGNLVQIDTIQVWR